MASQGNPQTIQAIQDSEDDGFDGFMELQNVAAAKPEHRPEQPRKRKTPPSRTEKEIQPDPKRQRMGYLDESNAGYVEEGPEGQENETNDLTDALNSFAEMMFDDNPHSRAEIGEKAPANRDLNKPGAVRNMYEYLLEDGVAMRPKSADEGELTEEGELSDNEPLPHQREPDTRKQVGADLREEEHPSATCDSSDEEGDADSESEDKPSTLPQKVAPAFQDDQGEDPALIPGLGSFGSLVPVEPAPKAQVEESDSESESESSSSEEVEGGWSVIKGGPPRTEPSELKVCEQAEKKANEEKGNEKKELDPKDLADALKLSMDKLQKEMVIEKNREVVLQGGVQDPRHMNWTVKNWLPGMTPGQLLELQEKGIDPRGFIEKTKQDLPGILLENPNAKVDPTKPLPSELRKLAEQAKSMLPGNQEKKPDLILLAADKKISRSRSRSRSRSYSSGSSRSGSDSYSSSDYSSDYTSSSSDYSSDDDLHYGKLGGYYRKKTPDSIDGSKSLYVWGFPPQFRSRDLQALFKRFGCYDATVVFQKDGRSRCFGFVDFSTYEEATLARFSLNGIQPSREFKRKLRVAEKTKVGSKKAIAREKVRSQMKKFADQAKQRKTDLMMEFQHRNQRASSMVAQAVRQLEVRYDSMKPVQDPMKQKLSLLANGILGQSVDYKTKIDIINQKIKLYEQKIVEQERINKQSTPAMKSSTQVNNTPPVIPEAQAQHPAGVNQMQPRSIPIKQQNDPAFNGQPQPVAGTPPKADDVREKPTFEGRPRVEPRPKAEPGSLVKEVLKVEQTPKLERRYYPEQPSGPHGEHRPMTHIQHMPSFNRQRKSLAQQRAPIVQHQAPIVGMDVPPPPPPIVNPRSNPNPNRPCQVRNMFTRRFPLPDAPPNNFSFSSLANAGPGLRLPPDDLGIAAPAFRDRTEKIGTLSHRADAPVEQDSIKSKGLRELQ